MFGFVHAIPVNGPSQRGRSFPMQCRGVAESKSSLVRILVRTLSPTLNTVSTRPTSSLALLSRYATSINSRTVCSICRIRRV